MSIQDVLKILTNKKLIIDFLGYDETNAIIEKILNNSDLIIETQNIPLSFWKDVLENGVIVFSDYTYKTKNGKDEAINFRYIDIQGGKKHIPAFVYEKKRQIELKARL